MKAFIRPLIALIFFCLSVSIAPATNNNHNRSAVQNVWVQLVPPGKGQLRAITSARKCPIARFDGRSMRMKVRARPNANFDILTCELNIPKRVKDIRVAGHKLKPVARDPQRIAIVGDTGCRMKAGDAIDDGFQNCFDEDDWAFAKVAERVAEWEPDLIVQLGDYIYREQACPAGCTNCTDSPYNAPGQRMETWNVEFFEPGKPMLESAPIVLVRGDPEKCERAGGGYFRLFPYPVFKRGVKKILNAGNPYVFYIHPWEIDAGQPRMTGLSPLHRFRHYVNLSRGDARFASLLADFEWSTMEELLRGRI